MRLLPALVITACATTPQVQDRPPEAPRASVARPRPTTELLPWFRSWDADVERARLARVANEVTGIEAEYTAACGVGIPTRIIGSPLVRYRTDGWNTSTGVIIYLSPLAGTADSLLAELRCHHAGMLMAPFGMDDCPLDVPGVHIDARGDASGITLVLTVHDPALIPELQRRVSREVEEATRPEHDD